MCGSWYDNITLVLSAPQRAATHAQQIIFKVKLGMEIEKVASQNLILNSIIRVFLLFKSSRFSKLCYHLVQSGSIKKQAELDSRWFFFKIFFLYSFGSIFVLQRRENTLPRAGAGAGHGQGPDIRDDGGEYIVCVVTPSTDHWCQVSQEDTRVECEFRHLSLAEYLTALHVHITGEPLKVRLSPNPKSQSQCESELCSL